MANTTTGRRGSGGQLTLVWMALALVLVAGFLYWLAANSEPSRMVAVEEDAGEVAPDPMATGTQVGQRVTIVGPVLARTDSVLAAWEREGVITSEGQRMEMEFATTFIEARRVVVGQPAAR
jgi:hypothetical protein